MQIGNCPRCGRLPQLVPIVGGFAMQCGCQPQQAYITSDTGPYFADYSGLPPDAPEMPPEVADLYKRSRPARRGS